MQALSEVEEIDVSTVRELHGVVASEGATKGIIATTACGFTAGATEHLERNKWILEGREFTRLSEWLTMYERSRVIQIAASQ